MLNRIEIQKALADAELFRASLNSRYDDAAAYWRVFLAERIYDLRNELRGSDGLPIPQERRKTWVELQPRVDAFKAQLRKAGGL